MVRAALTGRAAASARARAIRAYVPAASVVLATLLSALPIISMSAGTPISASWR